jgi:hypothetical protein
MAQIEAGRQELQREIAVGHGVERIGHRPVEAQRLRRHVAVDREGRARKRRGAERAFVHPRPGVAEAARSRANIST